MSNRSKTKTNNNCLITFIINCLIIIEICLIMSLFLVGKKSKTWVSNAVTCKNGDIWLFQESFESFFCKEWETNLKDCRGVTVSTITNTDYCKLTAEHDWVTQLAKIIRLQVLSLFDLRVHVA